MKTLCIRFERDGDREKIYQLQYKSFVMELEQVDKSQINGDSLVVFTDNYNKFIVAEVDDEIIATVSLVNVGSPKFYFENEITLEAVREKYDSNINREFTTEARSMYISPEFRRYKLAIMLFTLTVAYSKKLGAKWLFGKGHEKSTPMYLRNGIGKKCGITMTSGKIPYELLCTNPQELNLAPMIQQHSNELSKHFQLAFDEEIKDLIRSQNVPQARL